MRRPWRTTAGGWHTETHDPHAHQHHEGSDLLLVKVFYEAVVQHVTYVTDFCGVGNRIVYFNFFKLKIRNGLVYTIHGKRPPVT